MTPEKRNELLALFDRFVVEYLNVDVGRAHLAEMRRAIADGQRNYKAVIEAANRGEDTTELVLDKFLPYYDSEYNRKRGAWTHYAPVINKEIRPYFEGAHWQKPEDWPHVARAVFAFVQRAVGNPTELLLACSEFSDSPYSKGFQCGTLSPILAAISPEKFVLINKKSLAVVNYFAGTKSGQSLREYPKTNAETWRIIHEVGDDIARAAGDNDAPAWMLYDIFTHWLAEIGYFEKEDKDVGESTTAPPTEIDVVRKLFTSWYPDESVRRDVLELLADDIAAASTVSHKNWSVTLPNKKYVRLNVSSIELFMAKGGELHLVIDGENLDGELDEIGWRVETHPGNNKTLHDELEELAGDGVNGIHGPNLYPSLSGAKGIVNMSASTITTWLPKLRERHLKLLAHASAARTSQSPWASSHAPVVIEFLNEELGRNLPQPAYVSHKVNVTEPINDASPDSAFTPRAFELLAILHEQPVKATYLDRKEEFHTHIEEPFGWLLASVAPRLSAPIIAHLETKKKLTSNILKNDYGRGGAWDYYWGAFYPKSGKRTEEAQLYIWMNKDSLEYGFYIGEYGSVQRHRFISAVTQYRELLLTELGPMFSNSNCVFGRREDSIGGAPVPLEQRAQLTFPEWLSEPGEHGINIAVVLTRVELLQTPATALVDQIALTFAELYPLVLLATYDQPLQALETWLRPDDGNEPEVQPTYSLEECAADTGVALDRLTRWVNAIHRKGQAILYGPPGTGKTFVADHLARHIIGGGDGFYETVQFHPAYSYEEFMQGIRPQLTANGALDYTMKRGRFLTFCDEAAKRNDLCVFIIDEINRANLARVFGELMYLLEYRKKSVPLAGGGVLTIPDNVRIIGTMNTADRSIALVDHALRRRFAFIELRPDHNVLKHYHTKHETGFTPDNLIGVLVRLNATINDPHYEVGISFFLREDLASCIDDVWQMEIEPYLQEYFFDQRSKAANFSWENVGKEILG